MPLSAFAVSPERPRDARLLHACWSPIRGAPLAPEAWHFAQTASTTSLPLSSPLWARAPSGTARPSAAVTSSVLTYMSWIISLLRKLVRDSLVAVDAGLAFLHGGLVDRGGPLLLHREIHRREGVAVAALVGIVRLHLLPDVLCQRFALLGEFFRRVDRAHELVVELVARLDLADHLRQPFPWNVAIGADRAHARAVPVVNRLRVFLVDRVAHLVAGDAELQSIGPLQRPIEAAPEVDSSEAAGDEQGPEGVTARRGSEGVPQALEQTVVVHASSLGLQHPGFPIAGFDLDQKRPGTGEYSRREGFERRAHHAVDSVCGDDCRLVGGGGGLGAVGRRCGEGQGLPELPRRGPEEDRTRLQGRGGEIQGRRGRGRQSRSEDQGREEPPQNRGLRRRAQSGDRLRALEVIRAPASA